MQLEICNGMVGVMMEIKSQCQLYQFFHRMWRKLPNVSLYSVKCNILFTYRCQKLLWVALSIFLLMRTLSASDNSWMHTLVVVYLKLGVYSISKQKYDSGKF